jgi:hypothetical protein
MATGKIANLTVGVGLDAAEFTSGLGKAEAQAEEFRKRMTTKAVAIGTAIGTIMADVGRELAQAIPAIFNGAVDSLDAFNDLRDVVGDSVENLSGLATIGARTGASFDTVSGSLVKFTKLLGEAGDNAKGDALRALGLDIEKLRNMPATESLQQMAVALQGVNDSSRKGQLLIELFGRSAAEIAPFLNDLADAGSIVASATTEQAQAAEDYNKAMAALRTQISDATRSVVADMLPVLTEVVRYMTNAAEGTSGFGDVAMSVFRGVVKVGADVGFVFGAVGREIAAWAAQLVALGNGDLDGFNAISEAVKRDGERARVELEAFKRRIDDAGKSLADLGVPEASYSNEGRAPTQTKVDAPDLAALEAARRAAKEAEQARARAGEAAVAAAKRQEEATRRYIDALDQQLTKTQELTAVEKVLDDMAKGRVQFRDAASAGAALGKAADIDASKRLTEQLKAEADQWERIDSARRDRAAAITEGAMTTLEKYNAAMKELQDLRAAGYISQDTLNRSIQMQSEAYQKAMEKANEAANAQSVAAEQAARNIQDLLGKNLADAMDGSFKDILRSWLDMLQQMVAQALAADLMEKITGKGSSNNTANLVGGIIGLFAGGVGNAGSGDYKNFYDNGGGGYQMATGTNFVPYDGFKASLHKGEAVVPAKYNPANGGGSQAPIINNYGADVETKQKENGQLEITVRNMVRSTVIDDFSKGGPMSQFGQGQYGWKRQNPRR